MDNLISFIVSPQFEGWLLITKIIFIVFSLGLAVGSIVFLIKSSWLKRRILEDTSEFLTFRPYGIRKVEKEWNKILIRLDTGLESEYKLAVIEADSMLDDILKKLGYPGENLRERLNKLTTAILPNLEQVKEAHQIRNNIVHDPDYKLSLDDARKILAIYEKALSDLQVF